VTVGAVVGVLVAVLLVTNYYFIHQSAWEWLKLLIVPAVLAGGGLWFNTQQREREQKIANDRAQDEALQAYLDQISQLLTDKERPLRRAQPGDNLSAVARARTLTALTRLDAGRKRSVVQFLQEANLIAADRVVLTLHGGDLSGATLTAEQVAGAKSLKGATMPNDQKYEDWLKSSGENGENSGP
jgi:hypothetical protein